MDVREIHPLREVLQQETVGVFVRAPLPRTLWITEVNLDVGVQAKAFVLSHLLASIPRQRLVEFPR